jgi:hypothetical protein
MSKTRLFSPRRQSAFEITTALIPRSTSSGGKLDATKSMRESVFSSVHRSDSISGNSLKQQDEPLAVLEGSFAGLALLLTSIGDHGVTANPVHLRTREKGIRVAVGGTPRRRATNRSER